MKRNFLLLIVAITTLSCGNGLENKQTEQEIKVEETTETSTENVEIKKDSVIVTQTATDEKTKEVIEKTPKPAKEFTENLILTEVFDADGTVILNFKTENGKEIQFSQIDNSILKLYFDSNNEYGEQILKPEFLNKKFKATYRTENFYSEELAANGEDGNYVTEKLIKLTLL